MATRLNVSGLRSQMNLDRTGRVNRYNHSTASAAGRRATANFWRRKSTGGSGG